MALTKAQPQQTRQQPIDRTPKSIGTVLVVGGCGFLGSALVDHLLNFPSEQSSPPATSGPNAFPTLGSRYPPYSTTGTRVHALDLRCDRNTVPGATYHEADITSTTALLEVFKKVRPDVVINTVSPSWEAPHEVLRKVNIAGTKTLLDVAAGLHGSWSNDPARKCKAFVHVSSSSVISDAQTDLRNADERWPYVCPNPREYYSETKVHAEKIVLAANEDPEYQGILTCAVRPAGIIGEGDLGGFSGAILKTATVAPLWQLHLQFGDGSNLFDTTYVHNVAYGILCATDGLLATHKLKMEKGISSVLDIERVDGEAFIVTNDEPGYFWDSARYLYKLYGRDIQASKITSLSPGFAHVVGGLSEVFAAISGRKGKFNRQTVKYGCIDRYYSCDKLKQRCGYQPLVPLDEGYRRSVVWFKKWEQQQEKK